MLLFVAAAAVVVLVWPRGEAGGRRRPAPVSVRAGLPSVDDVEPDGTMTVVISGGEQPGVERGRCALRVRLLDQVTGRPFASEVELWRLDLPDDESWTAGDQRQATAHVDPDGHTFADLPAGCYRTPLRLMRANAWCPGSEVRLHSEGYPPGH